MTKIRISNTNLTGNEAAYLKECIDTNWISSLGAHVRNFEQRFSDYVGREYCMACSNGTVALHLALIALGIGEGDEVIVPAFTFVASVNAILYTGATPVFADITEDTWNMCPKDTESRITDKTKAIMFVNVYGNPADIDELTAIGKKHNLKLIEDNAEALGGEYKGRKLGGFGDISTQSFYGNKLITCGEGGMVSTNDEAISRKIKMLRDHGMDPEVRYYHHLMGYNYRITNLQAAVGLAQFERIDDFIAERERIFDRYVNGLKDCSGIGLPFMGDADRKPVNWLFTVLIKAADRQHVTKVVNDAGIDTRPAFIPIYKMPFIPDVEPLPVTERIAETGLSLPTYVDLSNDEVDFICETLVHAVNAWAKP